MPGVMYWDPIETPKVQIRQDCSILTVDCGNGVCCPLGSECVAISGGSSCAAGVSGLGSLTIPGIGSGESSFIVSNSLPDQDPGFRLLTVNSHSITNSRVFTNGFQHIFLIRQRDRCVIKSEPTHFYIS